MNQIVGLTENDSLSEVKKSSIGGLEHHIHKLFATVRVPGEDFVYSPPLEFFNYLDEYCSAQTIHEPKPPLIIISESGTGKSALLSNWLNRRLRNSTRSRVSNDEFIFWHAVGCSRQSTQVNSLIRRLMTDLKAKFELNREVPVNQERLSWELPRFLDLASKRGKVIIVIDGLLRLISSDGSEAGLSWLPLEFSPNVRIVLTATADNNVSPHNTVSATSNPNPLSLISQTNTQPHAFNSVVNNADGRTSPYSAAVSLIEPTSAHPSSAPSDSDSSSSSQPRKMRILRELERRKWDFIYLRPLTPVQCREVVDLFIKKSIQNESSIHTSSSSSSSSYATSSSSSGLPLDFSHSSVVLDEEKNPSKYGTLSASQRSPTSSSVSQAQHPSMFSVFQQEISGGFLLFESQIFSLLHHPLGTSPLFLRIFLRCAQYCVNRGFSIWYIWDRWLQATCIASLLKIILKDLETGFTRTRDQSQLDCDRTIRSGGLPALRHLYPWHPSFQTMLSSSTSSPVSVAASSHHHHHHHHHSESSHETLHAADFRTPSKAAHEEHKTNSNSYHNSLQNNPQKPPDPLSSNSIASVSTVGGSEVSVGGGLTHGGGKGVLMNSVLQSLGDQRWLAASNHAEMKLEEARHLSQKLLEDNLSSISQLAKNQSLSYIDALLLNIKQINLSNQQQLQPLQGTMTKKNPDLSSSSTSLKAPSLQLPPISSGNAKNEAGIHAIHEGDEDEEDDDAGAEGGVGSRSGDEYGEDDDENSLKLGRRNSDLTGSLNGGEDSASTSTNSTSNSNANPVLPDIFQGQGHRKSNKMNKPIRLIDSSQGNGRNTLVDMSTSASHNNYPSSAASSKHNLGSQQDKPGSFLSPHSQHHNPYSFQNKKSLSNPNHHHKKSLDFDDDSFDHSDPDSLRRPATVDPTEGLEILPLYFRGGMNVLGLGSMIGDSLALLHVSRLGLKETELWSMLTSLQEQRNKATEIQKLGNKWREVQKATFSLIAACVVARGQLEDLWRAEDHYHTGYLTPQQMVKAFLKVHPEFKKADLGKMIEILGLSTELRPDTNYESKPSLEMDNHQYNPNLEFEISQQGRIPYLELLKRVVKADRAFRAEHRGVTKGREDDYVDANIDMDKFYYRFNTALQGNLTTNSNSVEGFGLDGEFDSFEVLIPQSVGGGIGSSAGKREKSGGAGGNACVGMGCHVLGPVMEEALLIALSALGILHSPENQVLLLPSNSDIFRSVIRSEFVDKFSPLDLNNNKPSTQSNKFNDFFNDPSNPQQQPPQISGNEAWHGRLIRYFQNEQNSMRRCEELPWHLKICRRWHMMRNTLSDLDTFEMMFRSDLHDELMSYWLLLTEGPLFISDETQKQYDVGLGKDNTPEYIKILTELDTATALGLNEKDVRKQMLKNQVSPFDIVEEFNRSVENWVSNKQPTSTAMYSVLQLISQFILEFSRKSKKSPTFNRVRVDYRTMETFGITLDELKELDLSGGNSRNTSLLGPGGGLDEEGLSSLVASSASSEDLTGKSLISKTEFPSDKMITYNFYTYLRWIWLQYPWLSLRETANVGLKNSLDRKEQKKKIYSSLNKPNATTTTTSSTNNTNNNTKDSVFLTGVDDFGESGPVNPLNALLGLKDLDNSLRNRYWDVKKALPSKDMLKLNESRKQASVKSIHFSHSLNSLDASIKNLQDSFSNTLNAGNNNDSPSTPNPNIFQQPTPPMGNSSSTPSMNQISQMTGAAQLGMVRSGSTSRVRDKFRISLNEEMEAMKNIPFSSHTKRSLKAGSLFPSLDNQLKEHNRKLMDDGDHFGAALISLKRGGFGLNLLPELDDQIKQIRMDESLKEFNHRRGLPVPVTSEFQAEYEKESQRVAKLRSTLDKLINLRRARSQSLMELSENVKIREEQDHETTADIMAGELAINELNSKYKEIFTGVEETRVMNDGCETLLDLMRRCPAYTEKHMKNFEQNVKLARVQVQDLLKHRQKLYTDAHKVEMIRKRQLTDKMNYYKEARKSIEIKMRKFLISCQEKGISFIDMNAIMAAADQEEKLNAANALSKYDSEAYNPDSSRNNDEAMMSSIMKKFASHWQTKQNIFRLNQNLDEEEKKPEQPPPEEPLTPEMEQQLILNNLNNQLHKNLLNNSAGQANLVVPSTSSPQKTKKPKKTRKPTSPGSGAPKKHDKKKKSGNDSSSHSNTDDQDSDPSDSDSDEEEEKDREKQTPTTKAKGKNHAEPLPQASNSASSLSAIRPGSSPPPNLLNPSHSGKHSLSIQHPSSLPASNATQSPDLTSIQYQTKQAEFKIMLDFICEQTGSSSVEEFISRFKSAQKLAENLKNHQIIADSKLSQLRAEHNDMYGSWGDTIFIAPSSGSSNLSLAMEEKGISGDNVATGGEKDKDSGSAGAAASSGSQSGSGGGSENAEEHDARYFDNKLFAAEMQLSRAQRQMEKAMHFITDVKMGTGHLMNLLHSNSKHLTTLPKSTPPVLQKDSDIMMCLSWCEERILALNEVHMLETSKPSVSTNDDSLPLHQRQSRLAHLMEDMIKTRRATNNRLKKKKARRAGTAGGLSKDIIAEEPDVSSPSTYISSPRAVMVLASNEVDKAYQERVARLHDRRDRREDQLERERRQHVDSGSTDAVRRFLSEGLVRNDSEVMLRQTKMTLSLSPSPSTSLSTSSSKSNKTEESVSGKTFGAPLEEVLKSKGTSYSSLILDPTHTHSRSTGQSSDGSPNPNDGTTNNNNKKKPTPSATSDVLREGDRVEVNYRARGEWLSGKILKVKEASSQPPGGSGAGQDTVSLTFDIELDDGKSEYFVKSDKIRRPILNIPTLTSTPSSSSLPSLHHSQEKEKSNTSISRTSFGPGLGVASKASKQLANNEKDSSPQG